MAIDTATDGDIRASTGNIRKPLELKVKFVEWLFSPISEREHKTMSEWAAAHDVSRQTLWEWKNQDDEVLAMLKEWKRLAEANRPAVMGTLVKVATDPDHPSVVQAIRTYAELTDMFPSKHVSVDHNVTVTGVYAAAAAALEEGVIEGEVQE